VATRVCSRCQEELALDAFAWAYKGVRAPCCRACKNAYQRRYRAGYRARLAPPPETKTCTKCENAKPLTEFHRQKGGKYGVASRCKSCDLEKQRAYRATDSGAAIRRAGQKRARQRFQAATGVRHLWMNEGPARQAGAVIKEHIAPLIVLERDDGVCAICGDDVDPFHFTIDHVIPLSAGGEHSYENVQLAHRDCNTRKGATVG
jgi:hypothetical protein